MNNAMKRKIFTMVSVQSQTSTSGIVRSGTLAGGAGGCRRADCEWVVIMRVVVVHEWLRQNVRFGSTDGGIRDALGSAER